MATALIVNDNAEDLLALSELFRSQGYATETSSSLSEARDALLRRMPDVALIKETLGEQDSLELLSELDLSNVVEIYLMSSQRSLDAATRAMQLGVTDYLPEPVDHERLRSNLQQLATEIACAPEERQANKSGRGLLVGESPRMRKLYRSIRKCAPSEATVLVTGESGVGKELVAQTIHQLSARANCDFVPLNCGAIPEELMESELFGHRKGSFTGAARDHRGFFERATGGTLFLDEITELDPSLQAKLLRALETKRVNPIGSEEDIAVDARIVAATNQDTKEAVEAGRLREDLYYRLAQFPMRVPPLRERADDIDLLASYFLEQQNESRGLQKTLSDEAREALHLHDWPGNVRELKNAIMHGHLLAGDIIELEDLPDDVPSTALTRSSSRSRQMGLSLEEVERRHLLATLSHFEGDKKRCAEVLGISLKTLYNRLKKYNAE